MCQVIDNDSTGHQDYRPGPVRHDIEQATFEIVELIPRSSEPHGGAVHNGKLISWVAGSHPGRPTNWTF